MEIKIDCTGIATGTLTDSITKRLNALIDDGKLQPGAKMPSIRQFAKDNGVSRFTTVQIYDRLVALGKLESRHGSGFYVRKHLKSIDLIDVDGSTAESLMTIESTTKLFNASRATFPPDWLQPDMLERAYRRVARHGFRTLVDGYGEYGGYRPLREAIQSRLHGIDIHCDASQIITTNGALSAIDIAIKLACKPGDTAILDKPGYPLYKQILENNQINIAFVDRQEFGPNAAQLESVLKHTNAKLYISTTLSHNPTGANLRPADAFTLLKLADQYDFAIIEDDVFGTLDPTTPLRLATLDQVNRVFYVNSYSKTLSGKMRIGYLLVPANKRDQALRVRVGHRPSELDERIVDEVLREGAYRKHINQLIAKLSSARIKVAKEVAQRNFTAFSRNHFSMYEFIHHPALENEERLISLARESGLFFLTGSYFDMPEPGWIRLAYPWARDRRVWDFFDQIGVR
ncbi:MAG: PLP-dependent aminotransferase family protein [Gammaproteobacteria bacterium]|nr:PLP-dependent aminotransferase family protein [Gammaproteobacteria bacterium]